MTQLKAITGTYSTSDMFNLKMIDYLRQVSDGII